MVSGFQDLLQQIQPNSILNGPNSSACIDVKDLLWTVRLSSLVRHSVPPGRMSKRPVPGCHLVTPDGGRKSKILI